MRTKYFYIVFGLLMMLTGGTWCYGYPPENTAVLYYLAASGYHGNDAQDKAVEDYVSGKIELSDEIANYIQSKQPLIKMITDASEVDFCDWGLDTSDWMNTLLPPLGKFRGLARILLADAKISASEGDLETAVERYLAAQRMARHIDMKENLISFMVGGVIAKEANQVLQQLITNIAEDESLLTYLKDELSAMEPFSVDDTILFEFKLFSGQMTHETAEKIVNDPDFESWGNPDSELIKTRVQKADERFYERNRQYCRDLMAPISEILQRPYLQAYPALKALGMKPGQDIADNPNATLSALLIPNTSKAYNYNIQFNTLDNALLAAIEVYRIKNQTGRIPDQLPAGLPKDLFSGQDFEYEKTMNGFVLRCRAKDFVDNKIHEYAFGVQ